MVTALYFPRVLRLALLTTQLLLSLCCAGVQS
jgi:hypothetical protein